jgi:transposase
MKGTRQHYNEEFKKQAVRFVQEQTKSIPEIADEMNIPAGTLRQWLAQYREFESEPVASVDKIRELEAQLKDAQRQNADKDEEIAILKKAMHIFSKPRN